MGRAEEFNTIESSQWNGHENEAYVSTNGSSPGLFHRHINEGMNGSSHPLTIEGDTIINNGSNGSSSDLYRWMTSEAREAARSPLTIPMVAAFSLLAFGGLIFTGIIFGVTNGITKTAQQADDLREFASQLFDAFFVTQVLLGTPHRIQYLIRLLRWRPDDILSLRSAFSRAGPFVPKPDERKHLAIAIGFLLSNCTFQFILFGIMVGLEPTSRPPALVAILVVIALGSVATAGIYISVSPLSWPLDDSPKPTSSDPDLSTSDASTNGQNHSSSTQQLMAGGQQQSRPGHPRPGAIPNGLDVADAASAVPHKVIAVDDDEEMDGQNVWAGLVPLLGSDRYELQSKLVRKQPMWRPSSSDSRHTISEGDSLVRPDWSGGLFLCCEDPDVAMAVTFCCCCAHGVNIQRVGFGSGIVHTAVQILGIVSPVTVFTVSSRFISSESSAIKLTLILIGCCGTVCIGLLYLGYWRWRLRRSFGLPSSNWACGHKSTTDLLTSALFPLCAVCQEIRTTKRHGLVLVPMRMEPPLPMARPPAKSKRGWWGGARGDSNDVVSEVLHNEGQDRTLETVEEVDEVEVEPDGLKRAVERALSAPRMVAMSTE